MIGTLIAQELRATWKNLSTGVGIALLVVVVSFGLAALRIPVVGGIGLTMGLIVSAVIAPAVLGMLVENYWRTMYGREGYFTMTVPVRGRTLFAAKVLYGLLAVVCALAITVLCLLGGAVAFSLSQGQEPWAFVRGAFSAVDPWMLWFLAAALLLMAAYLVIVGAAVMSIGAQGRFNHLGFGAPVLGAVILYFVMQIVTLAAILFVPVGVVMTGQDAGTLVGRGMLDDFVDALTAPGGSNATPHVLGLGFVLTSVAVAALMAWWGGRAVERHTSLR